MKLRKMMAGLLAALLLAAVCVLPAEAANGGAESTVTDAMCDAEYWQELMGSDGDRVRMTAARIDAMNQKAVDASGTQVFDLETLREVTNASATRVSLSQNAVPTRALYINGQKIDNAAYYTRLNEAILATGYTETQRTNTYAVAVHTAPIKSLPTDDVIGYSATDCDDEIQVAALRVNEPFVIRGKCDVDGQTFYWGYAATLSGWVNGKYLAICANKTEWVNAWKVDTAAKDFLVVTQDQITLEQSLLQPNASGVKLTMGTILKLVPDSAIPKNIAERGTWYNHVVYLPVRNADGSYGKEAALIPAHYAVSIGFLPLTQNNLLEVAFTCLGNRYGWGNMLDAMDCSGYIQNIYRCFGLNIPRNTTWQQLVPGTKLDLSGMTDAEKTAYIATLPAGCSLYFSGHTMMYIGTVSGVPYVISATGSLADSASGSAVQKQYSVIVNPLTVRRASGNTWLHDLTSAVVFFPATTITDSQTAPRQIPASGFRDVSTDAYYHDAVLWAVDEGITAGVGQNLFAPDRTCTRAHVLTMLYRMAGCPEVSAETAFEDVPTDAWYAKAVAWAVQNDIFDGEDASHFAPNKLCPRAELITMLYRAAGRPDTAETTAFVDVPADAYYASAVAWALENEITVGVNATHFGPDGTCTRAQLVTFLYRVNG